MAAQRAVYGHNPITQKIAGLFPDVGSNGITPYSFRQGHRMSHVSRMVEAVKPLPIFVEPIAVAQVGDASAAQFTQASEWGRVRA